MQITGMLYGSGLLDFVGFPASEVLGPDASEEAIKALIDRHGEVLVKPVFKSSVGKKGKAGLVGRARPQDRAQGKGALVLRRAPAGQRQGERRHVRGRGTGRARDLFFDHGLDALPRAHDDAHPPRRRGHRGARQGAGGSRAVRPADRPQGVRRGQRAP